MLRFLLLLFVFCGLIPAMGQKVSKKPKNIILMIADGAGYNHFLAARYFLNGCDSLLSFEKFPLQLGVSTYPGVIGKDSNSAKGAYISDSIWKHIHNADTAYTNSAAAGTALACGIKTYNNAIGVNLKGEPIRNMTEYAYTRGRVSGLVTSVPFAHATPASFAAHNKHRNNYAQIARDMLFDSRCMVIMGCGHPFFDDDGLGKDTAISYDYVGDSLVWNLLKDSSRYVNRTRDCNFDGRSDPWTLISEKADFIKMKSGATPVRVLGIPMVYETLQQQRTGVEGQKVPNEVLSNISAPSLADMSLAAINVMHKNPTGFFMMVEGGAIDWAAHENQTARMLEEMKDFVGAVDSIISWVEKFSSWDETLIIITADHETGNMLGPNSKNETFNPIGCNGKGMVPHIAWYSKEHTNHLVPLFANGPGLEWITAKAILSDKVRGKYIDNTNIAEWIFFLWQ
jgi:alkaline phosphatase